MYIKIGSDFFIRVFQRRNLAGGRVELALIGACGAEKHIFNKHTENCVYCPFFWFFLEVLKSRSMYVKIGSDFFYSRF